MQSRKFELCFVQPTQELANAGAVVVASGAGLLEAMPPVVCVRMRAYDAKSYQYCLLAVKRNFFGLINRKWFLFVDIQTGVYYAFDSTEVSQCFGYDEPRLEVGIHKVRAPEVKGIKVSDISQSWESLRTLFGVAEPAEREGTQADISKRQEEERASRGQG